MAKKSKLKARSTRSNSLYVKYYKWWLLGVLVIAFGFYFGLFFTAFGIVDFYDEVSEVTGFGYPSDKHSLFLGFILRPLFLTGHGLLIYELINQVLVVWILWKALMLLDSLGTARKVINGLVIFYVLYPYSFFISNYLSKDQLLAVITFAFFVQLFKVSKIKDPTKKDWLVLGIWLALTILLKVFSVLLVFALIPVWWKHRRRTKIFALVGAVSVILPLLFNQIAMIAYGIHSRNDVQASNVAIVVAGQIFGDPNATISEDQRQYYEDLYKNSAFEAFNPGLDVTRWWEASNPFLSDKLKDPLLSSDVNVWDLNSRTLGLCFSNLGTCLRSYLVLMSGYYMPYEILYATTGLVRYPYFSNWTRSDNLDSILPTSTITWNTLRFCGEAGTDGQPVGEPIDFERYKSCMVENIGENGNPVADSLRPAIRATPLSGSLMPSVAQGLIDIANFFKFFLEGFWLFWTSLTLLIISLIKKQFENIRPLLWGIMIFYLGLFVFSPISYERYLFPLYWLLPFVIGTFFIPPPRSARKS
ncbi:MAG: hypothetical protein LBC43_04230 [Bifidobacteriaceae bacterium]|jgi:hypothetical protein|nr:hypothetical protein [Bifidobacteriaceae bacterium]